MDDGEVGRGRNKTSLKTAKQVVTAVVTHMKTCNVYGNANKLISEFKVLTRKEKESIKTVVCSIFNILCVSVFGLQENTFSRLKEK